MIKRLLLAAVLALSFTQLPAQEAPPATDVHEAQCPPEVMKSETEFWLGVVDATPIEDQLVFGEVLCSVVVPPISVDDFQSLAMLTPVFTIFTEVILPWQTNENMTYIIRGRGIADDQGNQFVEAAKLSYSIKTGNTVLSHVLIFNGTLPALQNQTFGK